MLKKIKPKNGWKMLYADIMKYWGTGYGTIFGRFYGIINISLLASTYLLVKGFELSFTQSILAMIFLIIVILTSGWLYIKYGFQKAEFSSNFKEQPELFEMYNRIERIEKKLDSILPKEDDEETKEFKKMFR